MNRISSTFRTIAGLRNFRLLRLKTSPPLLTLFSIALAAVTLAWPQVSLADTADDLRALQAKRFSALVNKDLQFLDVLLSPLLSYTHSNGVVETKQAFLDNIKAGKMVYRSIEPRDQSVIVDRDVGIVTGIGEFAVTVGGRDLEAKLRFTDVYVKDRNGQWKELAWQSLKLEPAPDPASNAAATSAATQNPSPATVPSPASK